MDFRHLESFAAVAKARSFSKAADLLYLTQPTISNHVNHLESEMNALLINRSNKRITLTPAGELLLRHVQVILNERDQALFDLEQYKGEITGTLDIASSSTPERYLLTDLLCSFSARYPNVRFNLMRLDSKQVLDRLLSGEIDFGIVGAQNDSKSQLIFTEIGQDEVVLIGPSEGPLSRIKELTAADLLKQRLIMRESGSGTRSTVENKLLELGIQPEQLQLAATMENTETIKDAVSKGMGLAFVSARAVENDLADGRLRHIPLVDLTIGRNFYFVYHKHMLLSPLSEKFRLFILESFGQ